MSRAAPLAEGGGAGAPGPATVGRQDTRAAWLTGIWHRLGGRLFIACDTEACWRGWDVTRTSRGLARSYRDPRFDARLRILRAGLAGGGKGGAR